MRKVMINKIKDIIKNKWYREIEENDIGLEELKQFQKEGAIIIDVRSPQEFREGHIDGAISIPEYEIKKDDTALVEHGYNHKLSGKEKHRKRIASVLAVVAVGVFLIILAIIYIDPWHVNKKDAIHINVMTREEVESAREGGFNLYLE